MKARRTAAWMVGVSLLAAGIARAGTEAGFELPELPVAEVSVDRSGDLKAPAPALDEPPAEAAPGLKGALPESAVAVAPPDLPEAPATFADVARDPATSAAADARPAQAPSLALTAPDLPDAAVVITDADRMREAVARALAEAGPALSRRLPPREREAVAAVYAARGHAPLWIENGAWTPAAKRVLDRLARADEDALDPADYRAPTLGVAPGADRIRELAEADIRLSAAALAYARDARGARVDLARISALVTPKLEIPSAEAVLQRLSSASDPGRALAAYNPPHPGYQALKRKLAEVRATLPSGTPMVRVPDGPVLRVGMSDPRVPLIRARLKLDAAADETAYDGRVASAVADFQREQGLEASGILNRRTVAALAAGPSPARLEGDIAANMERWRWLPEDMGERHILVNIPEYGLKVMDGGRAIHQARVITGKVETQTPLFSGLMDHAVVNPSWTIPPSIMKKEFLPGLAADPFYAERRGYQVIRRGNQITVRQPPGERNALGFIKFMFPNNHAVYLHDTPNRRLFGAARRAFSHGCVRVDQPFRLADVVLGEAWSEERLRSMIGRGERTIMLQKKLPVHLAYFTLQVDERGEVKQFEDIYGHNRRVRAALGYEAAAPSVAAAPQAAPRRRVQAAEQR